MRRTFLKLSLGLGVLAVAASAVHAQHHGGHGGGFGGGHGGFGGGHPGMHPQAMRPQTMPMHPGMRPAMAPRPASPRPAASRPAVAPRPATRPQGRGNLAARPSTRPSASARPSLRPSSSATASARPSSRPGTTTGRRPAVASSRTPGKGAGTLGLTGGKNTALKTASSGHPIKRRDLSTADNNAAITLLNSGKLSPKAQKAVNDALEGKSLSQAEITALKNNLGNLTTAQKAIVATILQTDQQIKRQNALANAGNGGLGGGGLGGGDGGLGGGSGLGGGDGGLGGGDSGLGGGAALAPIGDAPAPSYAAASDAGVPVDADDDGGVKLLAVTEGAAAEVAGLRAGDVILSFGDVRTRSFEELQDAVQQAGGPVKVVFINGENGQTEYLSVEPEDGRIGVTCD